MRKIETLEIKRMPSLQGNNQKKKILSSSQDFKEKLNSFLKEKTASKKENDPEKVSEAKEEKEEESDLNQYLHLTDLFSMSKLVENEANLEELLGEVKRVDGIEIMENAVFELEDIQNLPIESEEKSLTIDKELFDQLLLSLENQTGVNELKELDLSTLTSEEVLSAVNLEQLGTVDQQLVEEFMVEYLQLSNLEVRVNEDKIIHNNQQGQELFPTKEKAINQINLREGNFHATEKLENLEETTESLTLNELNSLEETETVQSLEEESKLISDHSDFSTINLAESAEKSVDKLDGQVKPAVRRVTQEDFVYELETLFIEESEAMDSNERVSTARIQLTPEKLGKVDLQIEMQGKDLVARLVVEQKETKEWIEQQVAHLKEQLLTQEIHVKDFEVLVHQDSMHDAMMDQQENPFFKQKQKETQERQEGRPAPNLERQSENQVVERPARTGAGISIFV